MYDSGAATDRQIQEVLGHTNQSMSRRYNHDLRGMDALKQAHGAALAGLKPA